MALLFIIQGDLHLVLPSIIQGDCLAIIFQGNLNLALESINQRNLNFALPSNNSRWVEHCIGIYNSRWIGLCLAIYNSMWPDRCHAIIFQGELNFALPSKLQCDLNFALSSIIQGDLNFALPSIIQGDLNFALPSIIQGDLNFALPSIIIWGNFNCALASSSIYDCAVILPTTGTKSHKLIVILMYGRLVRTRVAFHWMISHNHSTARLSDQTCVTKCINAQYPTWANHFCTWQKEKPRHTSFSTSTNKTNLSHTIGIHIILVYIMRITT